jgi:hypothetical protein
MKQLTIATLLCVAFSGLGNAAERKIAYEHDENIFVADIDGSTRRKLQPARCRKFLQMERA